MRISDWSSDVFSSVLLDPVTAAWRTLRPANGIYRRRRKDKGFGAHDLCDLRSLERPGFARAEGRCGAVSGLSRRPVRRKPPALTLQGHEDRRYRIPRRHIAHMTTANLKGGVAFLGQATRAMRCDDAVIP